MWNPKDLDTDGVLYMAIADALERDVRGGVLKPGQKMPTHRELADIIGVNLTTVTRAYREAGRRGLVAGAVGRGTYITADLGANTSLVCIEERPDRIIELGLVYPLYNNEPDLAGAIGKLANDKQLKKYLMYSDPLGLSEHREAGTFWVKRFGISATVEDMVICAGAQHALTCCLLSLFEAGDRIAVDCLTYPGLKGMAKNLGIKLEPIAMDREGMLPGSLEAACRRNPVKGLYLMPGMQNPTTACMSLRRREEIAGIIERRGLALIEDDIYCFAVRDNIRAIASLTPQNSVYIAGVSKAFYAGLRVAYVVAPPKFRYRIAQAVVNTIWMAPTLNAAIVSDCIRDGTADRIIALKLAEISKRFLLAEEKLSGYSFAGSPGSFFIWLNLPEHLTGKEFELLARKGGVNVFGAERFAVGAGAPRPAIRIALSGTETIEELGQGLDKLRSILARDYIDLSPVF